MFAARLQVRLRARWHWAVSVLHTDVHAVPGNGERCVLRRECGALPAGCSLAVSYYM